MTTDASLLSNRCFIAKQPYTVNAQRGILGIYNTYTIGVTGRWYKKRPMCDVIFLLLESECNDQ
jgi:hypothetical protein